MRWGRILVLALTGLVGLGVWMAAAEPWDGPTRSVAALELDEAWREDDAGEAGQPDVDDDDGDGTSDGARAGGGETDDGRDGTWDGDTRDGRNTGTGAGETDDGRDGTWDGDTQAGRGTGTGISGAGDGFNDFQGVGGGGTTAGDGGT